MMIDDFDTLVTHSDLAHKVGSPLDVW